MVSIEVARQLNLSLPEVKKSIQFNVPGFRINKKIFAIQGTKAL
jgi:hypothetical protein